MAKQQTVSTLRSLLRVFSRAHRHGESPVKYNFQMHYQWRGYIMSQYRQHQFEEDSVKLESLRQSAKDAVMLLDSNIDLKYLRYLDTGIKPFISEKDRIAKAAQRVGMEVTNVDSPEEVLNQQRENEEQDALDEKYRVKHEALLSKALGQAHAGRKRG